jgi:hypothetical protein
VLRGRKSSPPPPPPPLAPRCVVADAAVTWARSRSLTRNDKRDIARTLVQPGRRAGSRYLRGNCDISVEIPLISRSRPPHTLRRISTARARAQDSMIRFGAQFDKDRDRCFPLRHSRDYNVISDISLTNAPSAKLNQSRLRFSARRSSNGADTLDNSNTG